MMEVTDDNYGHLVWAKLGAHKYWPALIVDGQLAGMTASKPGSSWVFWFGDHLISQVKKSNMVDFGTDFKRYFVKPGGKIYNCAVHEALQECSQRYGAGFVQDNFELLVTWALDNFETGAAGKRLTRSAVASNINPADGSRVPSFVLQRLVNIAESRRTSIKVVPSHEEEPASTRKETPMSVTESAEDEEAEEEEDYHDNDDDENLDAAQQNVIKMIQDGLTKIEDVCISCLEAEHTVVDQHPLFHGGLCIVCKEASTEAMFAIADDGKCEFCCICCTGGKLVLCDQIDCPRVFCHTCLQHFIGEEALSKVIAADPWNCFVCQSDQNEQAMVCGLIHTKQEWQANLLQFIEPPRTLQQPLDTSKLRDGPLRVLSLFDGIGTAKLVLTQLGLSIDKYYASEVDENAICLAAVRHQNSIVQVGDITTLTTDKLKALLPLDLVIGGSPCNDLANVNPARKGIYDHSGTGPLFFEFYRVLTSIQALSKTHIFWLFENVFAMPHETKFIISRFLECDPAVINACAITAMRRARCFWGNIPNLKSMFMYQNSSPDPGNKTRMDSVLTPFCNRKAMVSRVGSVTTNRNSLRSQYSGEWPVSMNGKGDVLWITEIEKVFGFPEHYTDVCNMTPCQRQKLLGKSWSVSVMRHILTPLRQFFPTQSPADCEMTRAE